MKPLIKNTISLLIIITFILGFVFREDLAGGGHLDIIPFFNNFLIIKNNSFFSIPWNDYISSGFPLHHIIVGNVIFFSENIFLLKLFSFLISFLCILVFYNILNLKYKIKYSLNSSILLISVIPLLSPFFRTTGFWGLEENTCYLFFLISIYYFFNRKTDYYKYFSVFFAFLCILIRQTFVFLPLILFLYYFNFSKILNKKNLFIFFFFFICSIPVFYFIIIFGGPTKETNRIIYNPKNIPIIFSFFFIYLFPFIMIKLREIIRYFIRIESLIHLPFFSIFYFFFSNQYEIHDWYNPLGGGLIYKSIFNLNFFTINLNLKIFLFLLISYLGLFFLLFVSKDNLLIKIFAFVTVAIYIFVNVIFQEYFDPLIFFIVILFTNYIQKKDLEKFSIIILFFYFFIFMLSFTYRYHIIPSAMNSLT